MKSTQKKELTIVLDHYEAKALRRLSQKFLESRPPGSVGPMRTLAEKLIASAEELEAL